MSATKSTNTGLGNGSPYRVPPEPNRWPAIGLAVGVHALLLAFLWIGISWQNNAPVAVEAEIWDVKTQTAAPPAPAPAPEPEPEPETPPPQPAPKAVEPPPVVEKPQPKQPDIALEREKKRKEELKRKQIEEERLERERELAEQKRVEEKKAKALAEKKERELAEKKAQAEAEKKAQAEAEKKEAEKKKKEDAEKKKKEEAEKKKKAAEEQKKLDAARAEEMRRITGAAGNPSSTGTAEKSTAPRLDKGYIASIAAKIKSNMNYAGSTDVPGNPMVTFQVEQLPTGEIISVKKVKSSGIPAFDEAVERAINKSSPLPKKKDGTVERSLPVDFKLKDLN
jgi:colicin import membrane protein